MEVQLKSIKHELRRFSTVDYVEEFAECIIKDEHTRKCIIERYTNIFTTHKEKLDSFVFRDTDDNIIGEMYNNPDIISQICAESVDLVRRQLEDLGVITAPKAPMPKGNFVEINKMLGR